MVKDKMLFCSNCGERHKPKDKFCRKCKRKLPIKSRLLINYLKEGLIEEISGKAEENIISLIINFIKSHLYGTILTFSIVATIATIVTTEVVDSNRYEEVKAKPQLTTTDKIKPAADYTILENVEKEYFKMLETKNIEQQSLLFYDNKITFDNLITHEVFNDRNILYNFPEDITLIKGDCYKYDSGLDLSFEPLFQELINKNYKGERCLYYINYCEDDTCDEKAASSTGKPFMEYDYNLTAYVYYIYENDRYYVLEDTVVIPKDNFYREQFYEANGDVREFFENLVYPESAV